MAISVPNLFRKVLSDRFLNISFFATLILNILLWMFVFWKIHPQEEPIYLHYNIYFGINLIGPYFKIYFLPLSGLAIFLINFLLSAIIYNKEKIIVNFLFVTNVLVQISLWIATTLIILLNI